MKSKFTGLRPGCCYLRAIRHEHRDSVLEKLGFWPQLCQVLALPSEVMAVEELLDGLIVVMKAGVYHMSFDIDEGISFYSLLMWYRQRFAHRDVSSAAFRADFTTSVSQIQGLSVDVDDGGHGVSERVDGCAVFDDQRVGVQSSDRVALRVDDLSDALCVRGGLPVGLRDVCSRCVDLREAMYDDPGGCVCALNLPVGARWVECGFLNVLGGVPCYMCMEHVKKDERCVGHESCVGFPQFLSSRVKQYDKVLIWGPQMSGEDDNVAAGVRTSGGVRLSVVCVNGADLSQDVCVVDEAVSFVLPVGATMSMVATGVTWKAEYRAQFVCVLHGAKFRISGLARGCQLAFRYGDHGVAVSWLHKYFSVDGADSFARFTARVGVGIMFGAQSCGVSRSERTVDEYEPFGRMDRRIFPVAEHESDAAALVRLSGYEIGAAELSASPLLSHDGLLVEGSRDHVDGTDRYIAVRDVFVSGGPFGTAIKAVAWPLRVVPVATRDPGNSFGIIVPSGASVGLMPSVRHVLVDSCTLLDVPGLPRALVVVGSDDYALDDGGPSPDSDAGNSYMPDEWFFPYGHFSSD